ncbi:MAG TPA: DUF1343 domain-containing protein [Gemmatimonadaceae bacterium]|nr:DUF1343 domain-containing protein [Gemmatimonadaceae bacterium]
MPVPLRLALSIAALLATACASPEVEAGGADVDVLPGVEVLLRDSLHLLEGKRVGLITNHSGRDRKGTSTVDLLHQAEGVNLTALFAPEHGLRGVAEAGVTIPSTVDSATGVPIHSLYGATQVPTPEMLDQVDVLLYDIQDAGARVYTYEWTMVLAAEAATKAGKTFIVLDRPDPVRADRVEGSVLRPEFSSFVGLHQVALRYGLTPGELLRYLIGAGHVEASVIVVPMAGYTRAMWFDETGIPWVNPSPNLRDLEATLLYTGTVFFEGTNLSEGRGTDAPFRLVGAPWLTDAGAIAAELNAKGLAGVRFDSTSRTVSAGQKHGGLTIPMIEVIVVDRDSIVPVEVGAHMLRVIRSRHLPDWQWRVAHIDRLAGTDELRSAVEGDRVEELLASWREQARRFAADRTPYLLYE